MEWADSRVLWVPVEGERSIAVGERRIGQAMLYSLTAADEALLRQDWEELASIIGRGHVESLTGHLGNACKFDPKPRTRVPAVSASTPMAARDCSISPAVAAMECQTQSRLIVARGVGASRRLA
jgi:DNA mismatch repair endonuclease MutH